MSGQHKIAYRYCLCATFYNLMTGQHYTKGQLENIGLVYRIRELPRKQTDFKVLNKRLSLPLFACLDQGHFKRPYDRKFINNFINFFRSQLRDLSRAGISIFLAEELKPFLNLKQHFDIPSLSSHHWINLELGRGFIPTIPEMIIFSDLKAQWNLYIDSREGYKTRGEFVNSRRDMLLFLQDQTARSFGYTYQATIRTLIFLSVSFVESYLYNLFYCMKESQFAGKENIADNLNVKEPRKITDKRIIEKILFALYPDLKSEFSKLYRNYKKVLALRDRYVHASAFTDQSTGLSHLAPLLQVSDGDVVLSLQTAVDLVKGIDKKLPQQLKLLFWWYDDEINFESFQKISLTSRVSRVDKIHYYE